jgi:PiT family inorganic phosphate transporter
MGWALGTNDAANIFGLAVSTRVLRFWTAAILASLFVVLGAMVGGQGGFETYGKLSAQSLNTAFLVSMAAALTVTTMTALGLPVSTSQAVVGAIVGIGSIYAEVNWDMLIKVLAAWVFTPIGGAFFAYCLYFLLGRFVERWLKGYVFYDRALKVGFLLVGAYGAYSLGANNVANVTGVYVRSGLLNPRMGALVGSLAISLGILTYSKKVIHTIGHDLVPLDPFSGFVALLGEAVTLNLFAVIGVPVSASQAIVGSVLGIGLFKGVKTVEKKNMIHILLAWILTPTVSGLVAAGAWLLWRALL